MIDLQTQVMNLILDSKPKLVSIRICLRRIRTDSNRVTAVSVNNEKSVHTD